MPSPKLVSLLLTDAEREALGVLCPPGMRAPCWPSAMARWGSGTPRTKTTPAPQ